MFWVDLLITIIVPVFAILIFLVIWLFLKNKIWKFNEYYSQLNDFLQAEPYNDTKTTLRTIDINLNKIEANKIEEICNKLDAETSLDQSLQNDQELLKIQNDKQDFANNLIEIEDKISLLRRKAQEGNDYLNSKKLFKVQHNIFEIKKIKNQINKISKDVEQKVKYYIDEIEEINKVIYKYRNQSKDLIYLLNKWKDQKIDPALSQKMAAKINEIDEINNNLSDALGKRKIRESKHYFYQYKKMLFLVCNFANHYDQLVVVLYQEIPAALTKIKNFFQMIQKQFGHDLTYLEIEQYFDNAADHWNAAKSAFGELNTISAEKAIVDFYDVLLNANSVIKNELRAYQFVMQPQRMAQLNQLYQSVAKHYVEIKKIIDEVLAIDQNFFEWLEPKAEKLQQLVNDLAELKAKINQELGLAEIANLTRQHRIKTYLFLVRSFNEIYENIKNETQSFYAEGINLRLIFVRIKNLILSLNVWLKQHQIQLNQQELLLQQEVEAKRLEIDQLIMEQLQSEETDGLITNLEIYQNLVIQYLKTIGKKITICKIYTLLNQKYSYKRIENTKFHEHLLLSENHFLQGKYDTSLKLIVSAIKGGNF